VHAELTDGRMRHVPGIVGKPEVAHALRRLCAASLKLCCDVEIIGDAIAAMN
jgi:hypothetical protein